jgi:predicted TIM-barrel fold metal-dependent hydrolase
MIIDSHAHVFPDKIASKAAENTSNFYTIGSQCDGTVDSLLQIGQSYGIDKFLIHSVAQKPSQVKSINNFIAESCHTHPDHLIGFGALHRDIENPSDEIDRIISLGLKGIKLHPDIQQFNIDDPQMFPIYDYMSGRLPLLIHVGDYRYSWSHPSRLARVLDKFPKLTVIAAHFGGWSLQDLALEYLEHRKCYLDISSSIMFLGDRRAVELIRAYGAERMLFASDYPMWNPGLELQHFYKLGLTDNEMELILSQNVERALNIT